MKRLLLILLSVTCLFLVACSKNFTLPPAPTSPVVMQVRGANGITSSMPIDNSTVNKTVVSHVANGQAALHFSLTAKGAKALYAITERNTGRNLQMIWQGNMISNTYIDSPLGGSTMFLVIRLPDSTPDEVQGLLDSIKAKKSNTTD